MNSTTTPHHHDHSNVDHERTDLGTAVASLQLAGPMPLTVRRDRRRTPRATANGSGALFLIEVPTESGDVHAHPVVPGLVEGKRSFKVVERTTDGQIELGFVHLALRDSTLAGTLPLARQVYANIVIDQFSPDAELDCGDDLIAFLEACAARIGADGLVVTTLDHRLVTELASRGYMVDGPDLATEGPHDDNWRAIEERLEALDLEDSLASIQGVKPTIAVSLAGSPRADRNTWNASRSFERRGRVRP
jgi:hypothetical protein